MATGANFLYVTLTTTSSVRSQEGPRALGPSAGAERLHIVGEAHAHQLEAGNDFADVAASRTDAHVTGEMVPSQLAFVTASATQAHRHGLHLQLRGHQARVTGRGGQPLDSEGKTCGHFLGVDARWAAYPHLADGSSPRATRTGRHQFLYE